MRLSLSYVFFSALPCLDLLHSVAGLQAEIAPNEPHEALLKSAALLAVSSERLLLFTRLHALSSSAGHSAESPA